jgi:proliferating cell nuclear antigen
VYFDSLVFVAKTSSSNEWKTAAKTISALVEEASFEATSEGITFRAMDPSHVALVDLVWPNSAFEKYQCDKQFKFTVRMEDFVKLVGRADAKDSVEVSASSEDTLTLKFSNSYVREFNLHLIESTGGPTPLPKLQFNTKLLLTGATFQQILSDISAVSDHITIEATKDNVTFFGKSDSGSASATLDKKSPELLEHELKEICKATYSINYLLNITKAASSASQSLIFEYSSKMPLKLEFKLGDQGGKIHFFLAPRIEEK